jgi:hypothetical protein
MVNNGGYVKRKAHYIPDGGGASGGIDANQPSKKKMSMSAQIVLTGVKTNGGLKVTDGQGRNVVVNGGGRDQGKTRPVGVSIAINVSKAQAKGGGKMDDGKAGGVAGAGEPVGTEPLPSGGVVDLTPLTWDSVHAAIKKKVVDQIDGAMTLVETARKKMEKIKADIQRGSGDGTGADIHGELDSACKDLKTSLETLETTKERGRSMGVF